MRYLNAEVADKLVSEANFNLTKTIKSLPRDVRGLPFVEMKKEVLGSKYNLSLVFIGDSLSRQLNRTYREKDKPTDVLSFPLDKMSGEIFINLKLAEKGASKFGKSSKKFIAFLFIHGMLHLKGMAHGSRMEGAENKFLTKFKFNDSPSRSRD